MATLAEHTHNEITHDDTAGTHTYTRSQHPACHASLLGFSSLAPYIG